METVRYDTLTLCSDYRFIRVVSREGVFFDLVRKWRSREHVYRMQQQYVDAKTLGRALVPPCIVRDFTALDGPDKYREAVWKDGTVLLFPLTPTDRLLIAEKDGKK